MNHNLADFLDPKSQTTTLSPAGKRIKAKPIVGGCIGSQFMCNNSNCITLEQRCNQQDDCGDQSDEINCAGFKYNSFCIYIYKVIFSSFLFQLFSYISWVFICQLISFYVIIFQGPCSIRNGGCEHRCNIHPLWGDFCSCEAGYELTSNKRSCQGNSTGQLFLSYVSGLAKKLIMQ